MKYWSVAKKLQLIESNMDADRFNHKFAIIFWVGIVLNATAGLVSGVPDLDKSWFIWFDNVMQLCIFVSCGFLIDAFRLLSKLKS